MSGALRSQHRTAGAFAYTLHAPLAQRQSNGLLIRRFRVQIPRGAPNSVLFRVTPDAFYSGDLRRVFG
jgi:hypothetical protein